MALNVSPQMREKLAAVGDYPILDAEFLSFADGRAERAERVLGTKGYYVASPEDGWVLHGPLPKEQAE